jgi:thermitase
LSTALFRFTSLFFLETAILLAAGNPAYVPGRLIVGSSRGANVDVAARTLQMHRAIVRKGLPAFGALLVDVPEEDSEAILTSLRQTGLYRYVERDYYARTAATPNDPSYVLQWYLPKIQATQAWAVTTGSPSVTVAVIDSGVDTTHPDLASKLVPGWNYISNSATIVDNTGHGTAVAGAVAAASNNGIGISGVNWGSMVMPLVVVDSNEYASYSNIALAIQYAADHNARIINISAGGSSPSTLLQSAIDYAWSKGSVVFAAAMNTSTTAPYYPAACTNAVAVSATDDNDKLASFSNYGNWITLAAPGTGILSTSVGGGDAYWYGTSFSSPIAAGVAALALAVNPSLTNAGLVALMKQTADDLGTPGFDSSFGWGRVNAYKTVTAAQRSLTPVTISISPDTATLTPGQTVLFAVTVTGTTAPVTWSLGSSAGSISNTGLYTAPATIASTETVTATATVGGVTASATIILSKPAVNHRPAPPSAHPGHPLNVRGTAAGLELSPGN